MTEFGLIWGFVISFIKPKKGGLEMRNNAQDKTIYRNYVSKWKYMIKDYELIKAKRHSKFRFVSDFYKFHKTNRQTFLKYYHRYLSCPKDGSLMPTNCPFFRDDPVCF